MKSLEDLKHQVKILDYVRNHNIQGLEQLGGDTFRINPCPICRKKDHFTIYADTNSFSSFNGCCEGGSIIDFIMQVEKVDKEDAIKRLYEEAGEDFNSKRTARTQDKPERKNDLTESEQRENGKITVEEQSKKDFIKGKNRDFILNGISKKEHQEKVYEYMAQRGINKEICDKYNIFYSNNIYTDAEKKERIVIPIYHKKEPISYVARAIGEAKQKVLNSAGEQIPLNIDYIMQDAEGDKLIYICEGWADALSIEQEGKKAIALHSTQNIKKIIEAIKNNIDTASQYVYCFCLDNDKAGEDATEKAFAELEELKKQGKKIKYCKIDFPKEYKDINEYYIKGDKEEFKQMLIPYNQDTAYSYINNSFLTDIKNMQKYRSRKTGFEKLDKELNNICSGLYCIGAISSLGKTTFVHQMADQMAEQGEKIIYFSLEQSKFELISKSISRETFKIEPFKAKTNLSIMQNSNVDNITIEAVRNYENTAKNITIVEGNFNITVHTIRQYVENYIELTGNKPIVILDYLQILRPPISDKQTDKQQVDFNVSELKRISRDNDIPIFVICSFNRESYNNRVDFTSFKESGAIEYRGRCSYGLTTISNNKSFKVISRRKEKYRYRRNDRTSKDRNTKKN